MTVCNWSAVVAGSSGTPPTEASTGWQCMYIAFSPCRSSLPGCFRANAVMALSRLPYRLEAARKSKLDPDEQSLLPLELESLRRRPLRLLRERFRLLLRFLVSLPRSSVPTSGNRELPPSDSRREGLATLEARSTNTLLTDPRGSGPATLLRPARACTDAVDPGGALSDL